MIIGIGIDIVDVPRIEKAIKQWGDRFLNRIFTHNEIGYSKQHATLYQHFAARFAAKEAVLKAFDKNYKDSIAWTDIEIQKEASGRPEILLHGSMKKIKERLQVQNIFISLSHTCTYAIANVILTGT